MAKTAQQVEFIRSRYVDQAVGAAVFPAVAGIPQAGNPIAIVADYFLRVGTKTLDAICILCETGFPEDALVLARKLFEFGLHMQAIAVPATEAERVHRPLCFIYDGDRQRLAKLAELAEMKKKGKCVDWVDKIDAAAPAPATVAMPANFAAPKNLKDMAAEVGGEWECWYVFLYWSASKVGHPSGLGSHTYLQAVDMGEETGAAISLAAAMHYELTICVLGLLGLDALEPPLTACMREFIAI